VAKEVANMSRRFLRASFAALALFLAAAGSVSVRRANAVSCADFGWCCGGTKICATIYYPDGTFENCYGE
jgi:hypothetical protein